MTDRPFNPGEPIAYFVTWTSYGTWLPGDDRGWWQKGDGQRHAPNTLFKTMSGAEMKEAEFTLHIHDRELVETTVRRHCQIRGWAFHAVSARSNHVHVVVTAPGYSPETVRDQFKAWCSRKLNVNHPGRKRFWTEGASCRWINHEADLEAAIRYATEAQERKDREG